MPDWIILYQSTPNYRVEIAEIFTKLEMTVNLIFGACFIFIWSILVYASFL